MSTSLVQILIDTQLRDNANTLFDSLGLGMTTAVKIFFKKCLHINLPVRFRQFFARFNRVIQCVADYNRQIHHVNLYGR